MKYCNPCNTNKSLSEFSKSKVTKDGLQTRCKECIKQHRQDNKESIGEYQKQYSQDNKEYKSVAIKELHMSEGYGVYTLTHLPTQCYYVGEGQIHNRRSNHFSTLKKGENKCGLLQEHYNKHPNIDEWEFEVIYKFDDYDKETGRELEAFIIEESREKYPTQILNKKS